MTRVRTSRDSPTRSSVRPMVDGEAEPGSGRGRLEDRGHQGPADAFRARHGSDYHHPVMVEEVVKILEPAGEGEILDGTVGGGGHAEALLSTYPGCRILAVDRDPEALEEARGRLAPFGDRVRFLKARFDEAAVGASLAGPVLSGGLLDLGVSSRQIDRSERGFAFRTGAPLDMRMEGAEGGGFTAADILNQWEEGKLKELFRRIGEEPRARFIAREVVRRRREIPFRVADDLLETMEAAFRRPPAIKERARVFQALRIQVNDELGALGRALPALRDALLPGGILVVISYHSLEDRPVKQAFREWSRSCVCPPEIPVCVCRGEALGETLTRSVVRPTPKEVEGNPRSRSARLRAWRKAA
ncbi:MAG: 16S rRNA (cytosine(1402)-N(4))-methyltransferase RsmH [Gemmatimonadales bacterium]|nr:MAG: 16S rRNA (cytosine(1402)-N(4))-methyltransferase RsmH [Gemmatimonadales bacterium]